jgi:hypothetical protein
VKHLESRKIALVLLLGTLTVFSGACHRRGPLSSGAPASPPASNPFVGTWVLNREKGPPSGIERESITIEPQGSDLKLTYDRLGENGTELQWWFVTDMKGGNVKPMQVNGLPMGGESRFTLLDPHTFVEDSMIRSDGRALMSARYKVSADGQTMMVHTTFGMSGVTPTGLTTPMPGQVFVFDKVR